MEIFVIHSCLVLLFLLANADGHFHTLKFSSLFPHSVCSRSTGPRKGSSTLEITHRYGPCSTLGQPSPSLDKILAHDQARVRSIQLTRIRIDNAKADIPARLGISYGVLNYVVIIGLGTPVKTLTLEFDTGSSLTWTQCLPCSVSCHKQKDPIFNPNASTTNSAVSCSTKQCDQIGRRATCNGTACWYRILYGDKTSTRGFVSQDKLTLTSTDVIPNFLFGCSQELSGDSELFGQAAGILGLGKDPTSVISQTSDKYGRNFSYCLPPTSSTTGHLTLGPAAIGSSSDIQFTPFANSTQDASHYYIDILGITVGKNEVAVDPSVFKTSSCIIDSGTVINRLPPTAYSAMSSEFRRLMTAYKRVSGFEILDTCYDFSEWINRTIWIPKISFTLSGNVKVDLAFHGILLAVRKEGIACLAFAGNDKDDDLAIFGNIQQRTLEVVYDVAGGKLGFIHAAC